MEGDLDESMVTVQILRMAAKERMMAMDSGLYHTVHILPRLE